MSVEWHAFRSGTLANSVAYLCVASELEGFRHDGLVESASAQHECSARQTFSGWDHLALAKPTDTADERYAVPVGFILRASGSSL